MKTAPLRRLLVRDLLALVGLTVLALLGLSFWGYLRAMNYDAQDQARGSLQRMQELLRLRLRSEQRAADEVARLWSSGLVDPDRSDELQTALVAVAPTDGGFRSLGVARLDGVSIDVAPWEDELETEDCRRVERGAVCEATMWSRGGSRLAPKEVLRSGRDDVRTRPWFGAAIGRGSGAWGAPFVMPADGPLINRLRVTYATPVERAGRTIGVSQVSMSLDELLADVRRMQPTPNCLTAITVAGGDALGPDSVPGAEAVEPGAPAVSLSIGGEPYYVASAAFDAEPGIAWRVSLALPSRELLGGPRRVGLALLALALCAVGLVAWRARALAHRFSQPLRALAASTKSLTEGGAFEPPRTDIAEVHDLGARFKEAVEERRAIERRMIFADRMASVGTLAAGVAHEINNPLTYVVTGLEMLDADLESIARELPPGRVDEMTAMVRDARAGAERVRRIVRDLRTFSRSDSEATRLVDVAPVVESSINVALNEIRHRARLVRDLRPTPPVLAEEGRLGQVVLNLLVNAAQALPEGDAERNEIRVRTFVADDGRVTIEVSDTGPGIAPDVLGRIFEPFFTTKPVGKGTGLGLAICHGIVRSFGGEIVAHSVLGSGSTFRVSIPAAPGGASVEGRDSPPAEAPVCSRRGRILVVDDDEGVLRSIERIVSTEHDVVLASTARDALDRVTRGEPFDVILCDLMMPEMSGMDLHAQIGRSAPDRLASIVFVTGGAFTEKARAFLASVQNTTIEKPFDPRHLVRLLRKRVEQSSLPARPAMR